MPSITERRSALYLQMNMRCAWGVAAIALGLQLPTPASATALSSHPLVVAVRHGDCDAAVKLVNPVVNLNDDQTAFLAGRMLDEGICVKKDPIAAVDFFARAADLGDKDAALDYATKVGLGAGTGQSYERAGDLCRVSGFDPQGRSSRYSLGYACTVSGLAAELLREKLPPAAFGSPAAVIVDFSPASAQMHIRVTPHVRLGDAPTGSTLRKPVVDAQEAIEKAWRDAVAAVPKPDAKQLDDQVLELTLDVDTMLENSRAPSHSDAGNFQHIPPGDVHRMQ
jgi:TPR repeat protein